MSLEDTGSTVKAGIKTIAIRFKPDLHAQLVMIASLRDSSLQDEVTAAVETHIAAAKTDPQLLQKVEQAQAAIEQEALARRGTIATLFGEAPPAPVEAAHPSAAAEPAPVTPNRTRGSKAPSNAAGKDS